MNGAPAKDNASQLRNRKRVASKNRNKTKLVPQSRPGIEAPRPVRGGNRKVIIGYYLRSLWLTNSFVLFCLSFQISGLLGPDGILSAESLLENVKVVVPGQTSLEQFLKYPSIFLFIGASDSVLLCTCIGGLLMSLFAAVFGGVSGKILSDNSCVCDVVYCCCRWRLLPVPLGISVVEAHFIALFLPTVKPVWKGFGAFSEPREVPLLATHFLLFRFMWAMGIEKLPFFH